MVLCVHRQKHLSAQNIVAPSVSCCTGCFLAAKKQSGCTRLYSAWRKWTSETHADSFGPYCSWFQQHHNQSWQPKSPQYKLASRQQGARIAFPWQEKKMEESSVYPGEGLHRHFLGHPTKAPSCFSRFSFSALSYISTSISTHTILPHSEHRHPSFPSERGDCLQLGCIENILILCRRLEQTNYIILQLHSFHPTDVFISFPSPRLA